MVLSEYNPDWAKQFDEIKSIFQSKLTGIVFRIEHFGSTSVKDLSAKRTLDIVIVIPVKTSLAIIKEKLSELGYIHVGDQGIKGREVFKRQKDKEFYNPTLDNISHNLYAAYEDSEELERLILFRNYLIKNKESRLAYEKLKKDIAKKSGEDTKKYADIKLTEARELIYSIVEKAKQNKNKI